MSTLKLTTLTGLGLLLSSYQIAHANEASAENKIETVYCGDKAVGSEFVHNNMTYLVVDNESIRDEGNMFKLDKGSLRFCTSHVTNMKDLFSIYYKFNQPIGDWDVSNVQSMRAMFKGAYKFDQPIGDWDVSNVTDMAHMFDDANDFNQPIGQWDVSNVRNMAYMFAETTWFNQPIGQWDVSKVNYMNWMFFEAYYFNQPIGDWDMSNVKTVEGMFSHTNAFSQPLDKWQLSSITHERYVQEMFDEAKFYYYMSVKNWPIKPKFSFNVD